MKKKRFVTVYGLILVGLVLIGTTVAPAGVVTPQIGGGTVTKTVAPMIMPVVTFNGTNVSVKDANGLDWTAFSGDDRPIMRTLTGTDSLDSSKPWYSALNGKAWNWQYGWTLESNVLGTLPANSWIWFELLSKSDGLNCYDRTNNSYSQIFETTGSTWKWNSSVSMAHNAYTVTPQYAEWSANYRIYIGDVSTGADMGYGSDTAMFTWVSIPEPATLGLMGTGVVYLLGRKRGRERR